MRPDMEDNEEIVAAIFAAIKAYSSKEVLIKKIKTIDQNCNYINRWTIHTPQIFWKTRKG
jgi:hypothetical protein